MVVGNTLGREGFPDPPKASSALARRAEIGGGQAQCSSARRGEPRLPTGSGAATPFLSGPGPLPSHSAPPCTGGSVKPPTARPPGGWRCSGGSEPDSVWGLARAGRGRLPPPLPGPARGGGPQGTPPRVVAAHRPMSAPGAAMEAGAAGSSRERPGPPQTPRPGAREAGEGAKEARRPRRAWRHLRPAPSARAALRAAASRSLPADLESCALLGRRAGSNLLADPSSPPPPPPPSAGPRPRRQPQRRLPGACEPPSPLEAGQAAPAPVPPEAARGRGARPGPR